jgi:ElaB/YqjD/DUF883 family membrane-anchored ribosome-binding protein
MADEIRVQRGDEPRMVETETRVVRPVPTDAERRVPSEAAVAEHFPEVEDPDLARAQIEATRARMSETIDEIEGVLVRKKEEIQNRLDVLAPVRENPWPSMGIALGAGLVLGLLTGGGDDEDEEMEEDVHFRRQVGYASRSQLDYTRARTDSAGYGARTESASYRTRTDLEHRTEILEERTRRLLSIARDQEDEIRRLRGKKKKGAKSEPGRSASRELEHGFDEVTHYAEDTASRVGGVRGMVADAVVKLLNEAVRQLLGRR